MSPITDAARRGWSWVRASAQPHGWCEADANALAVADVTSIHRNRPETIRAIITETQHRYGGPEGVSAELSRRQAGTPREADRVAATLEWARRTLGEVAAC